MKIGIVTSMVPFVYGGAEFLNENLKLKLEEHGHQAQIIKLPFSWYPQGKLVDGIVAAKLTKIENVDKIIALKFPFYHIPHPNKQIWLVHQFRQAYDLRNTEYNFISKDTDGENIINTIIKSDNKLFSNQKKIYTISPIVSERLKQYNGFDSQPLCCPLNNEEIFYFQEYGDYIFYPSRVNASKRQYLAVEAMRYTKTNVKLVLAGKGDTLEDEQRIFSLIEKYNLSSKVTYINRFITDKEKADLYAKSLSSLYLPFNEDSYGYVTLEAIASKKSVITLTDSGGTDYIIKDSKTGIVTDPNPEDIARKMDYLYSNKKIIPQYVDNAEQLLNKLGINWNTIIERLV